MDLDQLKNRIEWLDDERRKDKATIAELQKKLSKIFRKYSSRKSHGLFLLYQSI